MKESAMLKVIARFALPALLLAWSVTPVAASATRIQWSQAVTDTETLTDTAGITATAGPTTTEAITAAESVTTTEEVTATEEVTSTAVLTDAQPAEAAPAVGSEQQPAAAQTGSALPESVTYALWALVAVLLIGGGLWLQRRGSTTARGG
jgi:carbohydrate-binding DOMON domain-containing protein